MTGREKSAVRQELSSGNDVQSALLFLAGWHTPASLTLTRLSLALNCFYSSFNIFFWLFLRQGGQFVPIFLALVAGRVRRAGRCRERSQARLRAHNGRSRMGGAESNPSPQTRQKVQESERRWRRRWQKRRRPRRRWRRPSRRHGRIGQRILGGNVANYFVKSKHFIQIICDPQKKITKRRNLLSRQIEISNGNFISECRHLLISFFFSSFFFLAIYNRWAVAGAYDQKSLHQSIRNMSKLKKKTKKTIACKSPLCPLVHHSKDASDALRERPGWGGPTVPHSVTRCCLSLSAYILANVALTCWLVGIVFL